MPNYRRAWTSGGCFFFTVVTYRRRADLCDGAIRHALRDAIRRVRESRPFRIEAWVLLPDHLHCVWTLPEGDADFSIRWRLIKTLVTRQLRTTNSRVSVRSIRPKRQEGDLWQRRYWEHRIRDEADFNSHCDYIHYNPVKHGLCAAPLHWPYSTFHRFVQQKKYPAEWGTNNVPNILERVGHE
jgi:putative transposase